APQAAAQAGVAQSAAKDPLPEDIGKSTVVKLCSECHALEQAVSVQGTEKDWRDVVDLMIERGANGSPE
ncbi:MAG: cytochrome C, partial [Acidobacteria bacterium]